MRGKPGILIIGFPYRASYGVVNINTNEIHQFKWSHSKATHFFKNLIYLFELFFIISLCDTEGFPVKISGNTIDDKAWRIFTVSGNFSFRFEPVIEIFSESF